MKDPRANKPGKAELEKEIAQLRQVLDVERQAILRADAKALSQLAVEKERVTVRLVEAAQAADPETLQSIEALRKEVAQLARLNHELLGQLYQHYHGMLEMLVRLAGQQGNTYGRSGLMDVSGGGNLGKPKLTV
ncbi:MAG: flagellar protein FlgN [Myxococcota bacterium]|jgi:DNA repair exonuclease SbcCD ATPase subunit|nr:flagellar protein FlgN [Myxococcota bacterium]